MRLKPLLMTFASCLLLAGCGGGGGGSSSAGEIGPGLVITDSSGRALSSSSVVASNHPLAAALSGFGAYDRVAFVINKNGVAGDLTMAAGLPAGSYGSILPLDRNGAIPSTNICQDLPAGTYTCAVFDLSPTKVTPKSTFGFTVADAPAGVTDVQLGTVSGTAFTPTDSFIPTDSIYAKGSGLPPNKYVRVYVTAYQPSWNVGDGLVDLSGTVGNAAPVLPGGSRSLEGTVKTVKTDANGALPLTLLWSNVAAEADGRSFDVVVDVNQTGKYAANDLIINQLDGSLLVSSTSRATSTALPNIVFDGNLAAKNTFTTTDNVYTKISQRKVNVRRAFWTYEMVAHKASWKTGDAFPNPFHDTGTVSEMGDNFKMSIPKSIAAHADLPPGQYDIIIHADDAGVADTYNAANDLLSGGASGPAFTVPARTAPKGKWTVMVYMDGDNNLYSNTVQNMKEIEAEVYKKTDGSQDVTVLVQLCDNTGKAGRYIMAHTTDPTSVTTIPIQNLGSTNMGSVATLSSFMSWSKTTAPADHYALIMWDHGGGFQSRDIQAHPNNLCWADSFGNASISVPELSQAVKSFGSLDVVAMDCCLMAEVETANELATATPVVVASENTEPGHGYDYHFLQDLVTNPAMTGADLGKSIVKYYAAYFTANPDANSPFTSVCYDETKVAAAASGIHAVAVDLTTPDTSTGKAILDDDATRNKIFTSTYQTFTDTDRFAYGDASDWLSKVKANVTDAATQSACDSASAAISSAVISESHAAAFPGAHGMTVWLPKTRAVYDSFLAEYNALTFASDNSWTLLLQKLFGDTITFATGQTTYTSSGATTRAVFSGMEPGHTYVNHVSFGTNTANATIAQPDQPVGSDGSLSAAWTVSGTKAGDVPVIFTIFDTTGGQRVQLDTGDDDYTGELATGVLKPVVFTYAQPLVLGSSQIYYWVAWAMLAFTPTPGKTVHTVTFPPERGGVPIVITDADIAQGAPVFTNQTYVSNPNSYPSSYAAGQTPFRQGYFYNLGGGQVGAMLAQSPNEFLFQGGVQYRTSAEAQQAAITWCNQYLASHPQTLTESN